MNSGLIRPSGLFPYLIHEYNSSVHEHGPPFA